LRSASSAERVTNVGSDDDGPRRGAKADPHHAVLEEASSPPSEHEAAAWCGLLERLEPNLAHDLRGPLNALTLHLELLRRVVEGLDAGPQAERMQRSLESLDREIERLTGRIDGLLCLVGTLQQAPVFLTLGALLEGCEHDLRTAARHRGVALRIEGGSGGPLRQRQALRRALLLVAFDALERAAAGDSVVLSCELRGDHAEVLVATASGASSGSVGAAGSARSQPAPAPPSDQTLARALLGRCGGELARVGSSWRLRFPVEIDS
jgi:hypothetical protein